MKINIVLGPFQPSPPHGFGAVEKAWHELAWTFSRLGHAVTLYGKGVQLSGESAPGGFTEIRLRGYSASGRIWVNLLLDLLYAFDVLRHISPADIVVTNSFWTPVVLSCFGRRAGKIVVHVARFPKGQMRLYGRAQILQAISSSVAAEIVRQAPSLRSRVRVLPYPIDLATYGLPPSERNFGGAVTVLYVGRIHPEKGLDLLVHAFAIALSKVPKMRLRIAGPHSVASGGGGERYLQDLKLASNGLPVQFLGPISEPRVLAVEYAQAHCFCYPSVAERGEAFGLSVLEAMATGLPVIVSDLDCFDDLVEHGREGLRFDHRASDSARRLADCMNEMFCAPGFAAALSKGARARACRFELGKVAEEYIALFEQSLVGTRG